MKKFNEINIKITKARITNIYITFDEASLPSVAVHGKLITETGLEISSFNFDTESWQPNKKFEIPANVHPLIRGIFDSLLPIMYEKINGMQKKLK